MSIAKFYVDELIVKGAYAEKYPGEPFDLTKATDAFFKDQFKYETVDGLEVSIQLIDEALGDELLELYGIDHPILAFGSGRVDYRKRHYELWIDTNDTKKWTSRIFTNVTPADVMGSSFDSGNETFGFFSHEFDEGTDFIQILYETEAEAIKMIDMAIDKKKRQPQPFNTVTYQGGTIMKKSTKNVIAATIATAIASVLVYKLYKHYN